MATATANHLFISDSGAMFDTRISNWNVNPLRENFRMHVPTIETVADFKACLRAGSHSDLSGYPLFFLTSDNETLSFDAARSEFAQIATAIKTRSNDGWRVIACQINYEDVDMVCVHTGAPIPSAYGEDETETETAFVIEGVDNDGSRTVLGEYDNSGEAREFMRRYVSRENAGNWDLIEIYDRRGEDAERIAFWDRDDI